MKKLLYYTTKDIEEIFDVSHNVADRIMRNIKKYRDQLKVKGKILISDFEAWYEGEKDESTL